MQKSLPFLRHSLMMNEMSIEGVQPPKSGTVTLPPTPVIPQVQVCRLVSIELPSLKRVCADRCPSGGNRSNFEVLDAGCNRREPVITTLRSDDPHATAHRRHVHAGVHWDTDVTSVVDASRARYAFNRAEKRSEIKV